MNIKQRRLRKIVATVIFTVLIWVFADLALDEELTISNLKLSVAKSVNPTLWVTFSGQSSVPLEKVVLKGSARKIAEARQSINAGRFIREFYFDPEHEKMTNPGDHLLNVAEFLKGTDSIRQLGLTITSADPNTQMVSVVELQKKQVVVRCLDDNLNPLKVASIEPAQVEAFVPAERGGAALEAKVSLNRREIEQARLAPIEKTPIVELSPGQTREAASSVKITLPKEQERLQEYLVTSVRYGISLSANLEGKYKVELVNPEAVMGSVAIRATPEAKRAYENMRYHVILEIDDSDKDSRPDKSSPAAGEPAPESRRDLVYNFPPEFLRKDEIALNQSPVQARFRLVPIAGEAPVPVTQPAQK
ncbi:MAG: hypothetical protein ABSB25_00110 [Sedimentisphaerales bacterium]|jgi:hypothetical protein